MDTGPNFDEVAPNVDEILREFDEIARESVIMATREVGRELRLVNAALYCVLGIFPPSLTRWHIEKREVIWSGAAGKRASPTFIFLSLLANIANSVLAIRRLAESGLDKQARVIFREMTEVADLLVVIVGDEEYLDRYLGSPEDFRKAYDYWREYLRPHMVQKRIETMARQWEPNEAQPENEGLLEDRRRLYQWLSKSAHVDYGALVIEAVAGDFNDRLNINLGGRTGSHTLATLQHLVSYLYSFLVILARLLYEKHQWNESDETLYEPLRIVRRFAESYTSSQEDTQ